MTMDRLKGTGVGLVTAYLSLTSPSEIPKRKGEDVGTLGRNTLFLVRVRCPALYDRSRIELMRYLTSEAVPGKALPFECLVRRLCRWFERPRHFGDVVEIFRFGS